MIVDDVQANVEEFLTIMEEFPQFTCVGMASAKDQAIDMILELMPQLVFIEIAGGNKKSDLSLSLITELHQYLNTLPKFIITTASPAHAFDAIGAGVFDYVLKPVKPASLRKTIFKYIRLHAVLPHSFVLSQRETGAGEAHAEINTQDARTAPDDLKPGADPSYTSPVADSTTICIKSYGDYQFIPVNEIMYLKADNNTTDFILQNGRKLTAYKTLKHYEVNLPYFFFRVHNSYIVNSNHVSRINTGKSLVYLNGGEVSISFSKTFKDNIDTLIKLIAPEYL